MVFLVIQNGGIVSSTVRFTFGYNEVLLLVEARSGNEVGQDLLVSNSSVLHQPNLVVISFSNLSVIFQ